MGANLPSPFDDIVEELLDTPVFLECLRQVSAPYAPEEARYTEEEIEEKFSVSVITHNGYKAYREVGNKGQVVLVAEASTLNALAAQLSR